MPDAKIHKTLNIIAIPAMYLALKSIGNFAEIRILVKSMLPGKPPNRFSEPENYGCG